MMKTVELAIRRISRRVDKVTGGHDTILDFLYDAAENYEYTEDGKKATSEYIINGLYTEADNYIDLLKQQGEIDPSAEW